MLSPSSLFIWGGHIQQKRKNSIETEVTGNQLLLQPCEAAKAFAHAQYLTFWHQNYFFKF